MSSPGASARGAASKFGQGVGVGVAKRKSRKLLQYQYVCAEPPKADMDQHRCDVRFVPKADILRCGRDCYSITSSAATSIDCGTVSPSAFAVLRLMTNSSFTACWTGRSVVLAPLRILPA